MYISRFKVRNYKSFYEPDELVLKPGFNIISGQNNAGKTAILGALSLGFTSKPHRSERTVKARDINPDSTSTVDVSFVLPPQEAIEYMQARHGSLYTVLSPQQTSDVAGQAGVWLHQDEHAAMQRIIDRLFSQVIIFRLRGVVSTVGAAPSWSMLEHSGAHLYPVARLQDGNYFSSSFRVQENHPVIARDRPVHALHNGGDFGLQLFSELYRHIYRFRAERMNIGQCTKGPRKNLVPDSSNLPEVLSQLQGNPVARDELQDRVREVLPQIRCISAESVDNNNVEIRVWPHDPATKKDYLALPLSECGTGIGQVLAVLYVVLNSERPQVIIIDEPQSFLHPGAARKLIEILKQHPKHQYIMATHSPTIVSSADPQTITIVTYNNCESQLKKVDMKTENGLYATLTDLGVRLSDVFGFDEILWVEGRTEEICFPKLVDKLLERPLRGTRIVGIRQTGDLEGRDAERVFEIYNKLSGGPSLIPPALAFILDDEGRTEEKKRELRMRSGGRAAFLPRRMYENYLLGSSAIASLANSIEGFRPAKQIAPEEVQSAIEAALKNQAYYCGKAVPDTMEGRRSGADAAKIIGDIFSGMSENRVAYQKVDHGSRLTDWIIANSPEELDELAEFLQQILDNPPRPVAAARVE